MGNIVSKEHHKENWQLKKLNDVSKKISLNKLKIKQRDYLPTGLFPVVDQGQELIGGYYNDESLIISEEPPYVIFGDHTKVKKFIPFRFIPGADGVKVLKANENILPKFLYYLLFTIKIEDKGYARHFQLLEKESFLIPEDFETQHAIVSKIEELFSELDQSIANLKTAQEQLKMYRQSVLKYAFEGKEKLPIGELFDFVGGGTPSKQNPDYWNGDIPWASVKDVKGNYLDETIDKITSLGLKNSSANIANKNDVIIITRISPGKAIISRIQTAINQDLKVVKPKFKTTSKFVFYVFQSIQRECLKKSNGTTVLGINLSSLKEIEVTNVSLEEQHLIVQEIESRLSVADKMEESIQESLQKAEALRQSILKKAFSGELV